MSAADAKLAAMYLKTGYWIRSHNNRTGKDHMVHRYYPNIRRAVQHCKELKALRDKYGLSNRQLYRRMKQHDKNLVRHTVHLKYELDDELKEKRSKRAASLLARCGKDPGWLERTYFVDACSIMLDCELKRGIQVYCDAYDKGYQEVINYHKLHKDKPIKVSVLCAVNAKRGAVYLECLTGTTDLQPKNNKRRLEDDFTCYKVSMCGTSVPPHHYIIMLVYRQYCTSQYC